MTGTAQNPWQREGVSILPDRLSEMSPIVGQKRLFDKLSTCKSEIESQTEQDLSNFFMIIGGWGVGKSRVGHEICLEAVSDDVDWIIDGEPRRIFEAGLAEGTLPLFVRYIQVTAGPLGARLEADNWIPSVAVEALAQLAGMRAHQPENKLARNQDRILDRVRTALKPRGEGWDRILPALRSALETPDPHAAAKGALAVLRRVGIKRLWLVMDEIEDITDVQRDGLPSRDRQGIDQSLLTVIPRVIKAEEARQEYPEVNFLLLCSLAVGDLLRQIRAIERRTGWHELTTNTFNDVNAFFNYLKSHRPRVATAIANYPSGLKEAAFFAANRNFGWFNVIMHHAHENHRGGKVSTPDLLKKFAESATKGGRDSVFDTAALGPTRVEPDEDGAVEHAIYSLLPREIRAEDGIEPATADRFLAKQDHGHGRPLFTSVLEIEPPAKHRIMAHMVASGFRNTQGAELVLMGEVRFDLELVLSGLAAYSIGLPEDRRDHWLICADETEFTHQIAGLSPYPEQAQQFAPYLHGLLLDPAYRAKDAAGVDRAFVAPAFSFLRDFNRLNKTRIDDQGYLRDGNKNSRLEEALNEVEKQPEERARRLLQGLANAWETDAAPAQMTWMKPEMRLPAARWSPSAAPLDLAAHGRATILYATGATDAELETDLRHLAGLRGREGAEPVVVLFQEQPERAATLGDRLPRLIPSLAPLVVAHNLVRRAGDDLVRLGLLGEAFEASDLRTSHFHAVVGRAREHFKLTLDRWVIESLEHQGMILRPLFYGTKVSDADIRLFARGYAALRAGRSLHDITQPTSDVFENDGERDRFKKVLAKHIDPGPKYVRTSEGLSAPLEALIATVDGDYVARVVRPFVAFMQRCSGGSKTQTDLERWFLFDVRNEKREELQRPRAVLHTWAQFLEAIGLLQNRSNKLECVSRHELESRLAGADAWLDAAFNSAAGRIGRIYRAAGEHLTGVDAKSASHKLKDARKKLAALDPGFLRRDWHELNRETGDDIPLYEQKLRATLDTVRGVREDIHWVYDPAGLATFSYNVDALQHFEANQGSPSFPLWRRVEILSGFYQQLDEGRKRLLHQIAAIRADVEARVPEIKEGPEVGHQAFPTQPLTLPLDMYEQELDFDADHPNKTVAALGTTLGVSTIGYKLVSGQYVEVLDRLDNLRAELFDGGKLVDTFKTALDRFLALREETEDARLHLDELSAFLADAPEDIVGGIGLAGLQSNVGALQEVFFLGDIRQKTDDREFARHKVTTLLPKLVEDLDGEADKPRQAREAIDSARQSLLPSLVARYQDGYRARINALYRIRRVQGKPVPSWPDQPAATWGATVEAFEAVVGDIATEGEAFFEGETETTFDVFVGFCTMDLDQRPIDWNVPENERHVQLLMRKGLLRLELVS